jgi:hypothetical protein
MNPAVSVRRLRGLTIRVIIFMTLPGIVRESAKTHDQRRTLMNLIQPVWVAVFLVFSGALLHQPAAAWAAPQPVPEGKPTGSSFCSAHGKYSGTNCPTCARGRNPSPGNSGLSAAERARLEREAAEAAERARLEAEKQRVAGENKDRDAALKNAVDRAKKVTAEFERQEQQRSEQHQGEVLGNKLINDLLKEFTSDNSKEPRFSKGTKESAPVDGSRKEPSVLSGETAPLEFMGIGKDPLVPASKPERKQPTYIPDPRMMMPGPDDLQYMFPGETAKLRWPGPINLGHRFTNPLIEEANKLKEEDRKQIERYKMDLAWTYVNSKDFEDRLLDGIIENTLAYYDSKQTTSPRTLVKDPVKSVLLEESHRLREARGQAVEDLKKELDLLEASGAIRKGENPFEREASDEAFRKSLNEARGRALLKLGGTVESACQKAYAKSLQVLGIPLDKPSESKPAEKR